MSKRARDAKKKRRLSARYKRIIDRVNKVLNSDPEAGRLSVMRSMLKAFEQHRKHVFGRVPKEDSMVKWALAASREFKPSPVIIDEMKNPAPAAEKKPMHIYMTTAGEDNPSYVKPRHSVPFTEWNKLDLLSVNQHGEPMFIITEMTDEKGDPWAQGEPLTHTVELEIKGEVSDE